MSSGTESAASVGAVAAPVRLRAAPTLGERLKHKVKEEPFVFGFLGLTVGALVGGLRALGANDARTSQLWMRARVFFQFCTVGALVGGIYMKAQRDAARATSVDLADARIHDAVGVMHVGAPALVDGAAATTPLR